MENSIVDNLSHRNTLTCPTCEFSGRPASAALITPDGMIYCKNCDSHWRNIETGTKSHQQGAPQYLPPVQPTIILWQTRAMRNGLALVIIFISTFFLAHSAIQLTAGSPTQSLPKQHLTLNSVKVENYDTGASSIWIISGNIHNNSAHPLNVPPILMRAGSKGSSGYFNWTYHPALQILSPGASFKFRTSVQKPKGAVLVPNIKFGRT